MHSERFNYIRNYYPSQPWGQHLDFLWRQASMAEWASLHAAGKLNAAQRAFFELKPVEELFDCVNDPDNVRNLAGAADFLYAVASSGDGKTIVAGPRP